MHKNKGKFLSPSILYSATDKKGLFVFFFFFFHVKLSPRIIVRNKRSRCYFSFLLYSSMLRRVGVVNETCYRFFFYFLFPYLSFLFLFANNRLKFGCLSSALLSSVLKSSLTPQEFVFILTKPYLVPPSITVPTLVPSRINSSHLPLFEILYLHQFYPL